MPKSPYQRRRADDRAQLAATRLVHTPADALAFVTSPKLPETMDKVGSFSIRHGLLGEGAKDVVTGDKGNVKLRFDPTYVRMAAEGKL